MGEFPYGNKPEQSYTGYLTISEASDWFREGGNSILEREASQTWSFRGSKSRNKVS
ncbi:unnamed protein product, partial [Candida parapsilosis]